MSIAGCSSNSSIYFVVQPRRVFAWRVSLHTFCQSRLVARKSGRVSLRLHCQWKQCDVDVNNAANGAWNVGSNVFVNIQLKIKLNKNKKIFPNNNFSCVVFIYKTEFFVYLRASYTTEPSVGKDDSYTTPPSSLTTSAMDPSAFKRVK